MLLAQYPVLLTSLAETSKHVGISHFYAALWDRFLLNVSRHKDSEPNFTSNSTGYETH